MIKKLLLMLVTTMQVACAHPPSVPVLTYHRVSPDTTKPSPEDVQITRFEEHLKMMKDQGYKTLTVTELVTLMKSKQPMPLRAVVLTFDDGWQSNIKAQQLLAKYNYKGTFYIVSGMLDTPIYLTTAELRQLAASPHVEIGAHSHTHFLPWATALESLDSNVVIGEMRKSKALIEGIIKKPVKSFAWPFGHIYPRARNVASSMGYTSIVEINRFSLNEKNVSPLQVQRLNIDGRCTAAQVQKMIDTGALNKCNGN